MRKLIILMSVLLLASCSFWKDEETKIDDVDNKVVETKIENTDTLVSADSKLDGFQIMGPQNGDLVAILETSKWEVKIRLFKEDAPLTVANFVWLAQDGYYKNYPISKVIKNFKVEFWPEEEWEIKTAHGWTIKNEFNENLKHIGWAVYSKNEEIMQNGSTFGIIHDSVQAQFDNNYTVFGQVFDSEDVLNTIAWVEVSSTAEPEEELKVLKIEIKEYQNWEFVKTSYKWDKVAEDIVSEYTVSAEWSTVDLHYELKIDGSDEVFQTTYTGWTPFTFVTGRSSVIKWFEEAAIWMKVWEEKTFSLAPADAYGEYDEEKVRTISKAEIGEAFDSMFAWGQVQTMYGPFKVVSKDENSAKIDFNHSLAGKTLDYKIEVVWIR